VSDLAKCRILLNLPDSWEFIPFNESYTKISINKKKVKQKEYLTEGIPVVDQGQTLISGYTNRRECLIHEDSPLIIFGDHTKVIKYLSFSFAPGADGITVLKTKNIFLPKLYFYFIHVLTKNLPDKGYSRHFQFLSQENIPLPPLNEQKRIVNKIEELFSELDHAVESFKKIQQQLKIYRQAVLKAAFEGKLTEGWRKNNQVEKKCLLKAVFNVHEITDVFDSSENFESQLPSIPSSWEWVYLRRLGELARGKSKHRPRNDSKLFGGEYPFVQTGEIKAANPYLKSYHQTYSEIGLSQSRLWDRGTLCITIAANIAETAILDIKACFPDSIVGFTSDLNKVLTKYILYFIQASKAKIQAFAPATAQKNINLATLQGLVIPYCSLEEQNQIVQEIESRLSICDELEKTIEQNLILEKSLRQSILKKAFEGKLVSQDPNDEPAELLLEKVKLEKEKLANSSQTKTKREKVTA
jgi:type I restriction enzyme S subunit